MKEKIAATKAYYDQRFGQLSQDLNEEETIRWNAINAVLEKASLIKKPLKIADFGCGRGWVSNKLSTFGEVTGFDVSEKAVENAGHSFPHIKFVCLDASESIPQQFIGSFDLVVSSEVIEHIDDQLSYAKNMSALLGPGGQFLITTPNGKWFDAFYREERSTWKQPIENWLTLSALSQLFKNAGLAPAHSGSFNSEWIFSMKPQIRPAFLTYTLTRKVLKALGLYARILKQLNARGYGINIFLYGNKK